MENKQRLVVAIVVKDGSVISYATNEHKNPCKRIGYPTGEGYELCEECDYSNHAEIKALKGIDAKGAIVYVLGHHYACIPCMNAIGEADAHLKVI